MTTLDKIKAEIQKVLDAEGDSENAKAQALALFWVLEFLDKYAEQEPCDDVVNRQAVLDVIYGQHIGGKEAVEHGLRNTYAADLRGIADEIIALPPVRPQEKTGHWEWLTEDKYRCSNCNHETRVDECMNKPMYDFCPFCNARMVEPQESESKV